MRYCLIIMIFRSYVQHFIKSAKKEELNLDISNTNLIMKIHKQNWCHDIYLEFVYSKQLKSDSS